MRRISTATKVTDKFGVGKHGFTNGNVVGGIPSTDLEDVWFDSVQEELANFVEAAGIALDGNVRTQMVQALRSGGLVTGIDTGVANACVVALTPAVPAVVDGMVLWFKAKFANTGATTLNVNGLGALPLVGAANSPLQGGEIVANGKCMVVADTALGAWILIECTGAALQVGPATKSAHAIQFGQATGRWINRQVITANGTYVPTAGTLYVDVTAIGGGGGGGGGQATGAGQTSAGAGGGGAGWARKRIPIASATGASMTVGIAGAAGAIGGGAGQAGGATSFGALVSATGGGGGSAGLATSNSAVSLVGFGLPGLGSNGDINAAGTVGWYAVYGPSSTSGAGGNSYFGGGATWVSGTSGGSASQVRGGGGSGGVCGASIGTGAQGGAGGAGCIIIDEYA